jgi:DNA transformation protein and related proteins
MDRPAFVEHCVELLSPLGTVRVRRMFGGFGLYVDELFVAIVAWERLYLKADAEARVLFQNAGCQPFQFSSNEQMVSLGYWTAPPDALDSPALMLPWARLALRAALAARAAKAAKAVRPRAAAGAPAAAKAPTRRARPARPAARSRRG